MFANRQTKIIKHFANLKFQKKKNGAPGKKKKKPRKQKFRQICLVKKMMVENGRRDPIRRNSSPPVYKMPIL